MRQTVRYQRSSIFRRVCATLFDLIILLLLFVVFNSFIFSPIVNAAAKYDKLYADYKTEVIATHLYVESENNKDLVQMRATDENILAYLNEYNYGYTLSQYNIDKSERVYKVSNKESYNLFVVDSGTGNYVENVLVAGENDSKNYDSLNAKLKSARSAFYVEIGNKLYEEYLKADANKDFSALVGRLTALTIVEIISSLALAVITIFLIFPLIFKDRATPGMKMFHYQVISLKDGKVASRFQIFARFVYFALISVALGYFTFGLSIICQIFSMFLTNKRQTFHGILSKTAVVCINAGDNVREEEFITIDLGEKLDDEIVNETSDINDEKDIIDVEVSEKDETKE